MDEKFTTVHILKTTKDLLDQLAEVERRKLYDVLDIIVSNEWKKKVNK
jgi:hypothetical protein